MLAGSSGHWGHMRKSRSAGTFSSLSSSFSAPSTTSRYPSVYLSRTPTYCTPNRLLKISPTRNHHRTLLGDGHVNNLKPYV